jgi:eukaryotic-like serine/threonine-protein kinase
VEAESPPRLLADRYELGPVIGHGGMGEIRRARDTRLGRDVAIKLLRPDLARQDEVRARFDHEARAAARLSHPNVVAVYDSGELDGQPYIVMECLPGRTLADEMKAGPLPAERVEAVAADVLAALAAAHREGIVHRDVKPGNLLLTDDGQVKVSDFGIAKSAEVLEPTLTGQILGTPAYVAPERLEGQTASHQSDLYSLGVVLYEALAGHQPFSGDTPLEMARSVQQGEAEPLRRACPSVSAAMAGLIERAMATDPARRFATADDMANALAPPPAAAAAVDDVTTTIAVPKPHDTQVLTPLPPEPQVPAPAPARRRAPRISGPAIAVLVAIAIVLLALVQRAANDDQPPVLTTVPATTPATAPPAGALPGPLDDAIDVLDQLVTP